MKTYTKYFDTNDIPLVIGIKELSDVLGIGSPAAYKLVRSKQIASMKIGNSFRIPRSELLRFLGETA